jgi:hypothetical protein
MLVVQLKTTSILIILFLAVSIVAKSFGGLQPPNPALRGFIEGCEDKPQPCWYGIVPGETTVEEAHILTELGCITNEASFDSRLGFYLRYVCSANSPVYQIDVGQPTDFSSTTITSVTVWITKVEVGDLVGYFGMPKQFDVDFFLYAGIVLLYGQNIYGYVDELTKNVTLKSEVSNYSIGTVNNNIPSVWRGFIPMWRYCQLEPNNRIC